MTEHIQELAKRRAEAQDHVNALGMMGTPSDLAARVASDARYRLAQDALARADREYRAAINALTTEQLIDLSKSA
jgi:hypothetical protein